MSKSMRRKFSTGFKPKAVRDACKECQAAEAGAKTNFWLHRS